MKLLRYDRSGCLLFVYFQKFLEGIQGLRKRKRSVVFGLSCRGGAARLGNIGTIGAIYAFYTSPVTKFYVHSVIFFIVKKLGNCFESVRYYQFQLFRLLFIGLFTFVVLAELTPLSGTERTIQLTMEQVVWLFMITKILEVVREVSYY